MRTEKRWRESYRQTYISKYFPTRIQRDLEEISFSHLPEVDFEDGQGLYIWGRNATGKTLVAAELLLREQKRVWIEGGKKLLRGFEFISTPKLLFRFRQTYNKTEKTPDGLTLEEQMLKEYGSTYFLVLDDFGVEGRPTEWVINMLYLVINERYENSLPTVFTSNLDLNGISELFDDRIASRIERMCWVLEKEPWDKGE